MTTTLAVSVIALNLTLHCNYYTCEQEAIRIEQGDTVTFIINPTSL